MSTLKDVAKKAEVSTATVSHVLNETKQVRPEVAERVLAAARELGYYRNQSARTLRTGRSETLGLILPDLQNPFFPSLVKAIERSARERGYSLLLIDSADEAASERAAFELLAQKGVDGVVWIPRSEHVPSDLPFPLVVVDRPLGRFDSVAADHYLGGRLLAKHALELGHTSAGLLSGPHALASARRRRDGFVDYANDHGLEIAWEVETPFELALPAKARRELLAASVSLVVAGSDITAIGAVHLLQERGIAVPDEVSVFGFDDIRWASLVRPRLTTVRQPLDQIGELSVEILLQRISNPRSTRREELLSVELVERESAKALDGRATEATRALEVGQ